MDWQAARRRPPLAAKMQDAPGLVIGAKLLAMCRKCKARTEHTVVAKVGVKPTLVACGTCKDTHAFKSMPPRRPTAASLVHLSPEEQWTVSMQHARGTAKPYLAASRFEIGDRLVHPSFGEGAVVRLASATVCEVVFRERAVKLVMGPVVTGAEWTRPPERRRGRPGAGFRGHIG